MDKNIIKNYLKAFVSEAVSPTPATTPAIKLAKKIGSEEKKQNKQGVEAIAKDMVGYEKALTKDDPNQKSMAPNKYDYEGENEVNYHDQMEIMNGQEMVQYDREPGSRFKERAMKAIEGDPTMGNSPEWANVTQKGWGGDPEFGKNLVKKIKASEKKRTEQTPTSKMFGDDWEVVKDKGHKAYAFEGTNGKSVIKEDFGVDRGYTHFFVFKKNGKIVDGFDYSDSDTESMKYYAKIDLKDNDYYPSNKYPVNTAKDFTLVSGKYLQRQGIDPYDWKNWYTERYNDEPSEEDKIKGLDAMKGLDADYEKDSSAQQYGTNPYKDMEENTKNNKEQIKETMKRLKFNKEFNGFGNALKLIPESYKVDKKVFEMTDGNEHYRIRWEGSIKEGSAVILMASDKNLVNEDMDRMKRLMGYKSQETLGTVKGQERITENAKFNDIWNKTKKLMNEVEDNDGGAEEDEWDDAITSQAPEAKKHVEGSASSDKGTQGKAKTGHWEDAAKAQAPEAKKHVQGSVASSKATQATAKTGNLEDAIKSQAPEAKAHMSENKKKSLSDRLDSIKNRGLYENDDDDDKYNDLRADDDRINRLEAGMSGEEDDAPIMKRKDAYDASLDVPDPEDMEKSLSTTDIEKQPEPVKFAAVDIEDDDDDIDFPEQMPAGDIKLMRSASTGKYAIIVKQGGQIVSATDVPEEYMQMAAANPAKTLQKIKADKEASMEMSDDEIMETLNEILSEINKK